MVACAIIYGNRKVRRRSEEVISGHYAFARSEPTPSISLEISSIDV